MKPPLECLFRNNFPLKFCQLRVIFLHFNQIRHKHPLKKSRVPKPCNSKKITFPIFKCLHHLLLSGNIFSSSFFNERIYFVYIFTVIPTNIGVQKSLLAFHHLCTFFSSYDIAIFLLGRLLTPLGAFQFAQCAQQYIRTKQASKPNFTFLMMSLLMLSFDCPLCNILEYFLYSIG